MRHNFLRSFIAVIVIFFIVTVLPLHALSHYNTYKIIDNGSDANKLVWVIMGDGYTESQLDRFHFDAIAVLFSIFTSSPWLNYSSYINVYLIDVVSNESGADHPSRGTYVDTALDASYDSYEINHLLTIDDAKAFDAASEIYYADMVMVLVNDEVYGGSAGSTVVLSNNFFAGRSALHEIGHFIGGLADEYETPFTAYPESDLEPNVTYETEREKIPWNKWISPATPLPTPDIMSWVIGTYEGARYLSASIYRPRYTCTMRRTLAPYCEICSEAIVLNIYNHVNPIRNFTPYTPLITFADGEKLHFNVDIENPLNNALSIKWELDNQLLAGEYNNTLILDSSILKTGTHTIKFSVTDQTRLVRNDPHQLLTSSHSWSLRKLLSDDYIPLTPSKLLK